MGIFTAIGSAIGLINSNPTASEMAKDISSGVDMLIYTKEEQAIDKGKQTVFAIEAWLRMVESMKSSEAYRSITRRIIALFIIFNLISMIWLCIWAEIAATFGWFKSLITVTVDGWAFTPVTWATLKIAGVFQLGWVFCTIIVFYFGPQLVQMMTSKKKV